jgi:hypothetical protein
VRAQVTRVLLGDASGARLQMEVPLLQAHSDIRVRTRARVCMLRHATHAQH